MLNVSAISNVNQSVQLNKQNNTTTQIKHDELNYDTISFKGKTLTVAGAKEKNFFKRLWAAISLLFTGTVASAVNGKNTDLSYRDYVNVNKFSFPEGSTITLPNGESADLTEYANNNSFEYWNNNLPPKQEFVVLDPNSTEKQLKKFIPTLERSFSGDRLCIPHKGYGYEWIDLNKKNILVNEGKCQTFYGEDKIESYVPIDAVANGESGKIDISKVPYGKKIACYTWNPRKRFFVPAGSQININGNITKVDNNSLAGIYEGSDLDFEDSLSNFIYRNIPTDSKQSEQMFETITNSLSINKNNQKDTKTKEMMKDFIVVRSKTGEIEGYIKGDLTVRSAFYEPGNSYFAQIKEDDLTKISEFYDAEIKKNPNLSKYTACIILHNGRKPLVTASFKNKKALPLNKEIFRKGVYEDGEIKIDLSGIN